MDKYFVQSNQDILDKWWKEQTKTQTEFYMGYDIVKSEEVTTWEPIPSSLTGFILWLWVACV